MLARGSAKALGSDRRIEANQKLFLHAIMHAIKSVELNLHANRFLTPSLLSQVYYFFELSKVVVEFTLAWQEAGVNRMRWNLFTLLLIAAVIRLSRGAWPGESCRLGTVLCNC